MGFRKGSPCAEETVRSQKMKNPSQAKLFIYAIMVVCSLHCAVAYILQAPNKQTKQGMGSQGLTGRKPRLVQSFVTESTLSFGWNQIKVMILALIAAMKQ